MSFEGEPVGIDSDVDLPLSSNSDSCVFIASVEFDRGETLALEAPEQRVYMCIYFLYIYIYTYSQNAKQER